MANRMRARPSACMCGRENIVCLPLRGSIVPQTALQFSRSLRLLKISSKPPRSVVLFIDSCGGEIFPALRIFYAMRTIGLRFVTVAYPRAESGGFLILQGGHLRFAVRDASLMVHRTETRYYGVPVTLGEEDYLEGYLQLKEQNKIIRAILMNRGRPREYVLNLLEDGELFSADFALLLNLIDGILSSRTREGICREIQSFTQNEAPPK